MNAMATFTNKKRLVLFVLLIFASLAFLTSYSANRVSAYSGARLIDDFVFTQSTSMSRSKIKSFLVTMNSGIKDKTFTFNCKGAGSTAEQLYKSVGAPCGKKALASDVIYYASKIYKVNPRVILTTLQKEQSLITTTNPTSWQINQAMGYGCPTNGGCGSSNFFYQIDNGTWVLRFHYERARGNNSWWYASSSWVCGKAKGFYKPSLYPAVGTTFYDGNNVAYRKHNLTSAATSSLYCYTPHAYNNPKGLYGLPKYGTKGQYYTGSYNFVKFFNLWFGSTTSNSSVVKTIVGDWSVGNADELGYKDGNYYHYDTDADGEIDFSFGIGSPTDKVIIGDWDGDGKDEVGLRRGNKYYFDTDNDGKAEIAFGIGLSTDQVLVGDWDGNGTDNIGLKRGNKYYLDTNNNRLADIYVGIGLPTDKVIVGDWDGDGDDNIGLKRGNRHYLDTNNNRLADIYVGFGLPTDRTIIADWDGDGKDEVAVRRYNRFYFDYDNDGNQNKSLILQYL